MSPKFWHLGSSPCSSAGNIEDFRTGGRWFELPAVLIFCLRIDDSHCNRIHSSLTAVHCFDDSYLGKQPVARREYCAELKEFQESIDR